MIVAPGPLRLPLFFMAKGHRWGLLGEQCDMYLTVTLSFQNPKFCCRICGYVIMDDFVYFWQVHGKDMAGGLAPRLDWRIVYASHYLIRGVCVA